MKSNLSVLTIFITFVSYRLPQSLRRSDKLMRRREVKERRAKGHVSALERALPPPQLLPRSQRN